MEVLLQNMAFWNYSVEQLNKHKNMKQQNSVEKALMNQRITTTYLWCLQCFDAVGWAAEMPGHAACKKTELWGAGKVICLE